MALFKNIRQKISFGRKPKEAVFQDTEPAFHPGRVWLALLAVAVGLFGVWVAVGTYLFFGINRGELFVASPPEVNEEDLYNQELLQQTIERFERKRDTFNQLQGSTVTPTSTEEGQGTLIEEGGVL